MPPARPPAPSGPFLAFDPNVPLLEPEEEKSGSWLSGFVALTVMGLGSCMCLLIVALSGFAGVRDELRTVQTAAAQERQADLATQYTEANAEIRNENYEMALLRLHYILTLEPEYRDVPQLLAQVEDLSAITPSPSRQASPSPDADAPSQSASSPTATNDPLDPEKMFIQG